MKRRLIHFLSSLFPGVFIRVAYNRLVHPKKYLFREEDQALLDGAIQETVTYAGVDIQTYKWGHGEQSILLVHGWEGGAANFAFLIPRLVDSGFTVYAFDGPSHGLSADSENPLFDFPLVVLDITKKIHPDFIISHSFGSVSATYALAELSDHHISGCILITTPDRFVDRVEEISDGIGAASGVYKGLIKKIERQLEIDTNGLNVSDFVRRINTDQALIIHDVNDRVIPSKHSVNVHENWPLSRLELVEGTGHFRILKSNVVAQMIIDFLTQDRAT